MSPQLCFFTSIAFAFAAWGLIAKRYIGPSSASCNDRSVATSSYPRSFRFIGLGLLVPGVVSPDLPSAFAHSAAYGESLRQDSLCFRCYRCPAELVPSSPGSSTFGAQPIS